MAKMKKYYRKHKVVANIIRNIVNILLDNPEIIDALLDVPLWESAILFCYVVWMTYLWIEHIKQHYPLLYRMVLLADSYMPILSGDVNLNNLGIFTIS